jgi:hypothetical protein
MIRDIFGYEIEFKELVQEEITKAWRKNNINEFGFIQFSYKGKEQYVSLGGGCYFKTTTKRKGTIRMRLCKKDKQSVLIKALECLITGQYETFSVND